MTQVTFTDPRTGDTYAWPNNPPPDGITAAQKQRQIDRSSNTGNVGAVKQQGDDGPFVIHWTPLVFTQAHELALWQWYKKCKTRTILLTDFAGEVFEGQITTLARQQIGALAGPGETRDRGFYVRYEFEFEVYRFVSGVMATAGVAA